AVGEHRVLLGAAGLDAERLELPAGLRPPAEPVEGQAEQLAHGRRAGRLLGQGPQDAAGLLEPLPPEGLDRLLQPLLEPGPPVRRHRAVELLLQRGAGRVLAAPAPARARGLAGGPPALAPGARTGTRRAGAVDRPLPAAPDGTRGLLPQLALVDPLLRRPRLGLAGRRGRRPTGPLATPTPPACLLGRRPPRLRRPPAREPAGAAARQAAPARGAGDRVPPPAGDPLPPRVRRPARSAWPRTPGVRRRGAPEPPRRTWPRPEPAADARRDGVAPGRARPRRAPPEGGGGAMRSHPTFGRRRSPRTGAVGTGHRRENATRTARVGGPRRASSGSDLLSQAVSRQVPSALEGLTSVFGMGT